MKENPVLFSGEMVKAILDGRKTQTRRIMKPQPDFSQVRFNGRKWEMYLGYPVGHGEPKCPYGERGDVLWVRETWKTEELPSGLDGIRYRADDSFRPIENTADAADKWVQANHGGNGWRSPRFMPRWASRINLIIKDIRFEPLQSITEADVIAEGVACVADFSRLWDGINAKRGYPWESNPFVWVIEFEAGG
jgi:hypothetical protein